MRDLIADWRKRADDMDRTAKAYNRACVKDKSVQLILLARQARTFADELERKIERGPNEMAG